MNKVNKSPQNNAKNKSHPFWRWFWLTFLVISTAYAWYSFYAPSNDIKWVTNLTTHQEITENTGQNMLLFFTATWCSPCQIMKRQVFTDDEVESNINSMLTPILIDIDNPETKEFVKYYEVDRTPTTIILDSQGEILKYAVGKMDKKELLDMIHSAVQEQR